MSARRDATSTWTRRLRVAGHVRYAQTTPIRFPFRVTGRNWILQPGQQVSYAISGRLLLGNGLPVQPAGDPAGAVGIMVAPPNPGQPTCQKAIPGQTRRITVAGVPAVLRILNSPPKQFESLCAPDIHGLGVYLVEEGLRPLTGFFRHLHLLGADPDRWTTRPLP